MTATNSDHPTAPEKLFLTSAELAERWGVPASKPADMRHRKIGPAYVRIARLVRYPLEAVEAYEREHMVDHQAAR